MKLISILAISGILIAAPHFSLRAATQSPKKDHFPRESLSSKHLLTASAWQPTILKPLAPAFSSPLFHLTTIAFSLWLYRRITHLLTPHLLSHEDQPPAFSESSDKPFFFAEKPSSPQKPPLHTLPLPYSDQHPPETSQELSQLQSTAHTQNHLIALSSYLKDTAQRLKTTSQKFSFSKAKEENLYKALFFTTPLSPPNTTAQNLSELSLTKLGVRLTEVSEELRTYLLEDEYSSLPALLIHQISYDFYLIGTHLELLSKKLPAKELHISLKNLLHTQDHSELSLAQVLFKLHLWLPQLEGLRYQAKPTPISSVSSPSPSLKQALSLTLRSLEFLTQNLRHDLTGIPHPEKTLVSWQGRPMSHGEYHSFAYDFIIEALKRDLSLTAEYIVSLHAGTAESYQTPTSYSALELIAALELLQEKQELPQELYDASFTHLLLTLALYLEWLYNKDPRLAPKAPPALLTSWDQAPSKDHRKMLTHLLEHLAQITRSHLAPNKSE